MWMKVMIKYHLKVIVCDHSHPHKSKVPYNGSLIAFHECDKKLRITKNNMQKKGELNFKLNE